MGAEWAVCVAADENYALPLLMTLRSLARATRHGTTVYVLDCGLSEATRLRAHRVAPGWNVQVVALDADRLHELSKAVNLGTDWSVAALARLLAPELLPSALSRLVYIDSDVWVADDVTPLATLDLGGQPLGAVIDPGITERYLARLGADEDAFDGRYFNSGVMILDLERWRAGQESEGLMTTLARVQDRVGMAEQDLLNVHFARRWAVIDPTWNVQTRHFHPRRGWFKMRAVPGVSTRALWRHRRVVHFNGPGRPWNRGRHPGGPGYLTAWLAGPLRKVPGPNGTRPGPALVSVATLKNLRDRLLCQLPGSARS